MGVIFILNLASIEGVKGFHDLANLLVADSFTSVFDETIPVVISVLNVVLIRPISFDVLDSATKLCPISTPIDRLAD